jgi:hypothetical protein
MRSNTRENVPTILVKICLLYYSGKRCDRRMDSTKDGSAVMAESRINLNGNTHTGGTKEVFLAFAIILVSTLVYHAFFWNKYVGIQDGWGNAYAALIEQGRFPYRDFYLFAQPYSILLSTAIVHVFGNSLIVLRAWGIGERVIIAFLLYLLFRRVVSYSFALLLAVTALIFSTGTFVDFLYDYGQTCLVFILISAYLVSTYLIRYQHSDWAGARRCLLGAGLAGGFAFITKQSIGLFAPFVTLVFLGIFECSQNKRFKITDACIYTLMFLTPTLITFLILSYYHALQPYIDQVYLSSAASKGGLISVLFGAFFRISSYPYPAACMFAIATVFLFISNNYFCAEETYAANVPKRSYFLTVCLIIFAILSGYFLTYSISAAYALKFFFLNKHLMIYYAYFTCILLALYLTIKSSIKQLQALEWQWFYLASIAASVIYAQGFSSDYDVRSCALGMGMLLAMWWAVRAPFLHIEKNILLKLIGVFFIAGTMMQHYSLPFNWWGWISDSVRYSTQSVPLKTLAGLKMSDYSARVFSEVTGIIRSNTVAGDTIYEYPHMPLFYLLSDRYPSTWALTDYMDVCSDRCAKEDAARILKTPPKVLIIESFPEIAWAYHEHMFRHDHPSGQRAIQAALKDLIKRYAYRQASYFPSTSQGYSISVWVRGEAKKHA